MSGDPQGPQRRQGRAKQPQGAPREEALSAGLRYLGGRSRSEAEMRQRLRALGHGDLAIDEAIDRLKGMGYLDDRAMAARLVSRGTQERPMGKGRLVRDMKRAGLAAETIEEALVAGRSPQEEAETLAVALATLARRERDADPRVCRKLAAALIRRGFAPSMVFDAVGAWARAKRQELEGGDDGE